MTKRLTTCGLLLLLLDVSVSAQQFNGAQIRARAVELGTDGLSSRQARQILTDGSARQFPYPTLIVGIEKADRDKIRQESPGQVRSQQEIQLIDRLPQPVECGQAQPRNGTEARRCETLAQQRSNLEEKYLDDGKRTLITHVVYWPQARESTTETLHNAYVGCPNADSKHAQYYECQLSAYENSWRALQRLDNFIAEQLAQGGFTHILVLSKGWNTAQSDAVDYYREITNELGKQATFARRAFRPLVIGLTWHSGWVWPLSKVPVMKLLPKVASYGNKARDADEIGLTWANALLHRVLLPNAASSGPDGLPVILIGHSFGARILTRAAASGHLMGVDTGHHPSLVVSLQGAFSMNRFLFERCQGREGAPYHDLGEKVGRVALVWSRNDRTNPLAQVASHANHVGGKPGYLRARAYAHNFRFKEWSLAQPHGPALKDQAQPEQPPHGHSCVCEIPAVKPITMVEATSIVKSHGDVGGAKMAGLLWQLMHLGPEPEPSASKTNQRHGSGELRQVPTSNCR